MKFRHIAIAIVVTAIGLIAGCALFAPPATSADQTAIQQQTIAQQSQAITQSIAAANALLADIKAHGSQPVTAPSPSPTPAVPVAVVTTASPAVLTPPTDTVDKTAQALQLLTNATTQLNQQLQTAPTVQAQQQAALAAGIQTAQAAATTFGGQYGAPIAAGIGILGLLLQSFIHSKSQTAANQSVAAVAASAHETAQALVGKLPNFSSPLNASANVAAGTLH